MPESFGLGGEEDEIRGRVIKDEDWLWCSKCRRFFQVKDLTRDSVGGRQGCAFDDCSGEGIGYDLRGWDSIPRANPSIKEKWPKSEAELTRGLKRSIR